MAKLAPEYVHSNYDLYEQASPKIMKAYGVEAALKNIIALTAQNEKRLEQLELSFYQAVGLPTSSADDGYAAFVEQLQNMDNDGDKESEANIRQILINYVESNPQFFMEWAEKIAEKIKNKIQSNVTFDSIAKNCLEEQLKSVISQLFTDGTSKAKAQKVANDMVTKNEVCVNSVNLSGDIGTGSLSNLRGAWGEISGTAELRDKITQIAEAHTEDMLNNMTFIDTGQLKYQTLDNGVKEMSSDLVIEFITPSGEKRQIGFQIKSYNLSGSRAYKDVIKIASLSAESSKGGGWLAAEDRIVNEGLLNNGEFNALNYVLANYYWFTHQGNFVAWHPNAHTPVVHMNVNTDNALVLVKQVIGMLSVSTITRNLNDLVTETGHTIGTVQLTKPDGTLDTSYKSMNIPPVFWMMTNKYFFPTRWILRDLAKWLNGLHQQIFTPLQIKVRYTGEPLESPWDFHQAKAEVVPSLKRPPKYGARIQNVGKKMGNQILGGLQVEQNMAIIRKQLENVIGLAGLAK